MKEQILNEYGRRNYWQGVVVGVIASVFVMSAFVVVLLWML